jgi:hypothetical protein
VKPVIRESLLEKSSLIEHGSSNCSDDEDESFHGFSESEIDSARSRASSSLYSEEVQGQSLISTI